MAKKKTVKAPAEPTVEVEDKVEDKVPVEEAPAEPPVVEPPVVEPPASEAPDKPEGRSFKAESTVILRGGKASVISSTGSTADEASRKLSAAKAKLRAEGKLQKKR